MAWQKTDVNEERRKFVRDWHTGRFTVVELAARYGVSERVAHKTLRRFKEEGYAGLEDRSRARRTQASTDPCIVDALIACRRRHPTWGPRKLRGFLCANHAELPWPAPSTIGSILARHGLVPERRRRRARAGHSEPCVAATAPNVSWSMDFKGQFRLGNGHLCYPFTVTDNASRFILHCQALDGTNLEDTWSELVSCFRRNGLPDSIRSDNGSPFGASGLTGMSTMKVRLIRLGIRPDPIEPGKPQQNGRHERMHRTLKHETASPPAGDKSAQQRRFNSFVDEFNYVRPHEALDNRTPAQAHRSSPREMPSSLPRVEYDDGVTTRSIRHNGCFKWGSEEHFLALPLAGERVAFESLNDDLYLVRFSFLPIAVFDAARGKLHPAGKTTRG